MGKRNGVALEKFDEVGEVGDSDGGGGGEAGRWISFRDNADTVEGVFNCEAKGVKDCVPSSSS